MLPNNCNLPFFAYGIFRPGEIAYLGIKQYVDTFERAKVKGKLLLQDGITLYRFDESSRVRGYLIYFEEGEGLNAYSYIDSIEPSKRYSWKTVSTVDGLKCNILLGFIGVDSSAYEVLDDSEQYSVWDDPFFKDTLPLLKNSDIAFVPKVGPRREMFSDWEHLILVQMKYLTLWTVIERFLFFRYGQKSYARDSLSEDRYFREALNALEHRTDSLYKTEDTKHSYVLDTKTTSEAGYASAIEYYYKMRCNITHRGKALYEDHIRVEKSFAEMLCIMESVLYKTQKECVLILEEDEES